MPETYRVPNRPARPRPPLSPLALLGMTGWLEAVLLAASGWWQGAVFPLPGLLLFGGAFLVWVASARVVARLDGRSRDLQPRALALVWGVAVVLRVIFLPLTPVLSDDVYRYLWDGWVQLHGVNPYLYAPADPALDALHTSWHGLINHPSVPTIYPPAAQYAFLLVAVLGAAIPVAKLLWILLDLGTGWLLYRVARRSGRRPLLTLLLYLWCPLLVVETAWSGHLEALGLFWMALFLFLAGRGEAPGGGDPGPGANDDRDGARAALGGMALALAALTKFAPAAALPPLTRRLGRRFALACGLALLVGYLPYLGAGSALFTGLTTYAEHWRFNAGAFVLLERVFPPGRPARWAAGAIVLGVVAWATFRRFDPERSLFWVLGTGVVVSPTVHPWYVLWLLPFAALRKSRPWLLLSGLVFLGYWGLGTYQETGSWPQPLWARLSVWVPFWALLLYDALPTRREAAEPQGQIP